MKTFALRRSLAIGLMILLVGAFVVPNVARGTIIYVDDDNTSGPWDGTLEHPYQHIQDGIDNANSGDTVYVFNGTYYENVEVNKAINLIGENKDSTVIDAGEPVVISFNRVNLSGFTMQNGSTHGIYVLSDSNTITNNIVKPHWYASIYLFFANYNIVSGNTVLGPGSVTSVGIKERYSSYNTIIGNFVDNYTYGISSEIGSSNTLISDNTVVNCQGPGLWLLGAYDATIIDNTFILGGITISGDTVPSWNTHTIENNYVNGKPIYYYKNDSNAVTVPSDAGQVILGNCSNFTIQNLDISGVGTAVQLGFSSHNNINGNTTANNTEYSIVLYHSSNNSITGNIITNNKFYGIYLLRFSDNNNIFGNTIANNEEGVRVINSCLYNIISENTITDNDLGIRLVHNSGYTCNNNIIYHNNFINNNQNAYALELETCTNIWDDGYPSGGNYWFDFDEPDEGAYDDNCDGIVDSAYSISGTYNQDRFPLMNPWNGSPPTPNCGDASGDGVIDVADVVYLLNYLFIDGPEPWPALCVGDVDSDGIVNSADVVYLIGYLFVPGSPPPSDDCCPFLSEVLG